jgi:hypothetical protein
MNMNEKELIAELEKLGWKLAYLGGHGDTEAVQVGDFVVGDIEKSSVLVPPSCLWKEPVPAIDYW